MATDEGTQRLTVWYDGDCLLCRNEIAMLKALDRAGRIAFVDLSVGLPCPIDRMAMKMRFHAQEPGGPLLSGAEAFAAMWRAVPPLAPFGRMARTPWVLRLLEALYVMFLKIRPLLQTLAGGVRKPAPKAGRPLHPGSPA
jgi:predicted DCC family thiol-disulfide oxidoreductase YuxK